MFLLEKSRLDYSGRTSVVKVARSIGALANSHDDNGLLVGNWSGSYESGTPPWQWYILIIIDNFVIFFLNSNLHRFQN